MHRGRPFRATTVNRQVAPSIRRVSERRFGRCTQNDLLISTASQWRIGQLHEGSPDTTLARKEPRGLSQGEGCNPMASSEGPGRDVAYLILGNYGGTMKGAGPDGCVLSAFGGHCSCPLSHGEKLIFLLIVRKESRDLQISSPPRSRRASSI